MQGPEFSTDGVDIDDDRIDETEPAEGSTDFPTNAETPPPSAVVTDIPRETPGTWKQYIYEPGPSVQDARALVEKLAKIAGEMEYVQKTGFNDHQKYKFAREGDFKAKLKPLLAREEIHMGCCVETLGQPIKLGDSRNGVPQWLTTVELEATFRYRSASVVCSAIGQGVDPGDKGVYKAQTGALKYLISTSFQLETGDDPEVPNELDGPSGAPEAPRTPPPAPAPPTPRPQFTGAPVAPPDYSNTQTPFLAQLDDQIKRLGTEKVVWVAENKFIPEGSPAGTKGPAPAMMPVEFQRRFINYLKQIEVKPRR